MQQGQKIGVTYYESANGVGGFHQVVMNKASIKVAIKPSGKIISTYMFQVMDPAQGRYRHFANSVFSKKNTNVLRLY